MNPETKGRAYWRSLEEQADTPEFRERLEREFPTALPETWEPGSRRQFLKLMGASLALTGVVGCNPNNPTWPRWKPAKILPYAFRPEGWKPGSPQHFATSFEIGGVARALLAKSYDGRPIKIEGNPEHPASLGGADALSQASILGLYDPDRSRGPARFEGGAETDASWGEFLEAAMPALSGGKVAVLSEASSSPSLLQARARFGERYPGARWIEWDPITRDNTREGAALVYGEPVRSHYDLEAADVIVSLDDDFLMTHPNAVAYGRAWADRRRADDGSMNRLWVVESSYSVTGSLADGRLPVPSARVAQVAWLLAARVFLEKGVEIPSEMAGMLRPLLQSALGHGAELPETAAMAEDLAAHRGRCLVTVGPGQPPAVHAIVHVLNQALGAVGHAVRFTAEIDPTRPSHPEGLKGLVEDMRAGRVRTLLILGGNPVYDAPADLQFASALSEVPFKAHLSPYRDETSAACDWHVPRAHALEAWADSRTWDGTWTIAQPLIRPLYDGLTPAELIDGLVDGERRDGMALVKGAFEKRYGGSSWRKAVHDGFVGGSGWPARTVSLRTTAWLPRERDFAWTPASSAKTEVTFRPDHKLWDGGFANNGWLQELPDPMTKLTWDNAALVNPVTARKMGLKQGSPIRLVSGDRTIVVPVCLMPGQAIGSISLTLGWGRLRAGRVAERDSAGSGGGTDVYPLRTTTGLGFLEAVSMSPAPGHYALVTTQEHHAINNTEQGRGQDRRLPEIFREATLTEYREHPDFAKHRTHHPPLLSLWEERDWTESDRRWAMAIDLTACTGCSACVVACQSENNTPVVGKEEVGRGREMHWLRIDRYFKGDFENPEVAHQPITCHQCENAPCEQVCPVAATTHSEEGLNDMVYNRCVGTRYCSNNCPYKVRRFNYFNNQKDLPEILKMKHNPDVTVRARGVMEKCTYCVQRIKAAVIPADNERRPVHDGEIVPACAQTCPTRAIVFGDLNDPASRVRHDHAHPRSYALLSELNVKPRTRFLAKLRNPADGGHASGGGAGHEAPAGDPGGHGTGDGHGHG